MSNTWTGPTIEDNKFKYSYTADQAQNSGYTIKLATENKFVDKDIWVKVIIPPGSLTAGSGNVGLSNHGATGLLGTSSNSQPGSGHYLEINGNGQVSVATAGWVDSASNATSNTATLYYPINSASFAASNGTIYCSQAGYVPQGSSSSGIYTVTSTTLSTTSTVVTGTAVTRQAGASWGTGLIDAGSITAVTFSNTFTGNDDNYIDISETNAAPILASGSYLYINAGYTDNLKISLAKLIPDIINNTNTFVTADKILQGYVAFNKDGTGITGSIPSLAATTYTPTTSNQTIAAGQYLSGIQTIKGDSNLAAANIKSGVSIFGVTGTFTNQSTSAISAPVIRNGYIGYVNGNVVTGTMPDATFANNASSLTATTNNTSQSGTNPFSIYTSSNTHGISIVTATTTTVMGTNKVFIQIDSSGSVKCTSDPGGYVAKNATAAITSLTRYIAINYYSGTYTAS